MNINLLLPALTLICINACDTPIESIQENSPDSEPVVDNDSVVVDDIDSVAMNEIDTLEYFYFKTLSSKNPWRIESVGEKVSISYQYPTLNLKEGTSENYPERGPFYATYFTLDHIPLFLNADSNGTHSSDFFKVLESDLMNMGEYEAEIVTSEVNSGYSSQLFCPQWGISQAQKIFPLISSQEIQEASSVQLGVMDQDQFIPLCTYNKNSQSPLGSLYFSSLASVISSTTLSHYATLETEIRFQ